MRTRRWVHQSSSKRHHTSPSIVILPSMSPLPPQDHWNFSTTNISLPSSRVSELCTLPETNSLLALGQAVHVAHLCSRMTWWTSLTTPGPHEALLLCSQVCPNTHASSSSCSFTSDRNGRTGPRHGYSCMFSAISQETKMSSGGNTRRACGHHAEHREESSTR